MQSTSQTTALELDIKGVESRANCLYSEQEVEQAVDALALAISRDLHKADPLVLCIMNGGIVFTGSLLTRLNFPLQVDYLHATRYRDKTQGEGLKWLKYPEKCLNSRVVLLLDDILDEGETLLRVQQYCKEQGAVAVYSAVLIEKIHTRKAANCKADYIGLSAEDYYLYGYGMDYKGYLRNASGIFAVSKNDC